MWKLDRLARSLNHFTKLMIGLEDKNVKFKDITESFIDITKESSHSRFLVNMFAAPAQLESKIILERPKAGQESARLRGRILGAPKDLRKKPTKSDTLRGGIVR